MTRNGFITLLVLLVITIIFQSVVVVRDTEKAILLKLGAFERTLDPGLNFKVPFIDSVIKFEGRIRTLDTIKKSNEKFRDDTGFNLPLPIVKKKTKIKKA